MKTRMIDFQGTTEFLLDPEISKEDKLTCLCLDAKKFEQCLHSYSEDVDLSYRYMFKFLFKELIQEEIGWHLIEGSESDFVINDERSTTFDITSAFFNKEIGLSLCTWISVVGALVLDVHLNIDEEANESAWCDSRKYISSVADRLMQHQLERSGIDLPSREFDELHNVEHGWSINEVSELHYFMYRMRYKVAILPFTIFSVDISGTTEDSLMCQIGSNYFCAVKTYRQIRAKLPPTDAFDALECIFHAMYNNQAMAENNVLRGMEKKPLGI